MKNIKIVVENGLYKVFKKDKLIGATTQPQYVAMIIENKLYK